jgi:hypothetical protein
MEGLMEYGMHVEVPLPEGTTVNTYEDEWGRFLTINHQGRNIGPGWLGEYELNPPPGGDEVYADLVHCGVEDSDAQQIVDHLTNAGLAI